MKINELYRVMTSFLENSENNILPELGRIKIYEEPLIGIASAEDTLFKKLKEDDVVGAIHKNPQEWLPEAGSIISYFLPFTEAIRISNRYDKTEISTEWLYGRIEGEALNNEVRKLAVEYLTNNGKKAIAPVIGPDFKWAGSTSNWSERHVAYIAGLGTFGLHKSLITEKGCAGRFGSVITDIVLTPTERKYVGLYENCSMCKACIDRCPGNAIDETGKKHQPCSDFIGSIMKKYTPRYGCGKCLTKVPCENKIPKKVNE